MNVRVEARRRRRQEIYFGRPKPGGLAWMRAACPWFFLVLCLATTLFQARELPPWQGADELAHAYRVDLLTFGGLTAERVKDRTVVAGGATDVSLYAASVPFDNIRFNINEKADVVDYDQAGKARWDGITTRLGYPGSAIYPPFFYLPQGAGMALGKLMNLSVLQSLVLARMGNALICTMLGFAALMIAGRSRLLLFSLLMLPMSTAVFSILTNDGLMIACTALGVAVISRGMHEARPLTRTEVIGAATCFAMIGMTKLPYMFIGLIMLACSTERPRWRYIAAAAVVGCSLAWTLWMTFAVQTALTAPGGPVDPGRQVHFLLSHPLAVWGLSIDTVKSHWEPYLSMFIGVLGWLDTSLPLGYHRAAWVVLGLALAYGLSQPPSREWRWTPLVSLALMLLAFGAIHGALYVTWTAVGQGTVDGVQGRYLIPLAVLACLAIEGERPALAPGRLTDWGYRAAAAVVLAFPLVSMLVIEHAVIVRYYLD